MNKKDLILIFIIILIFGCSKKVEINYVVNENQNLVHKKTISLFPVGRFNMKYINNNIGVGSDGHKIYSVNEDYQLLNSYKIVEGKGPGEGGFHSLFTAKNKVIWYDQGLNRFNIFNKMLEYQDVININEINLFQNFFKLNNQNYAFNITGYDNDMKLEIVEVDFNFKEMKTDFKVVNYINIGEMQSFNSLRGITNELIIFQMGNNYYFFDKNNLSLKRRVKLHNKCKNELLGNRAGFVDIIKDDILYYVGENYYYYNYKKNIIYNVSEIKINSNNVYSKNKYFRNFFGEKKMMYWNKDRDKVVVQNVKSVEVE